MSLFKSILISLVVLSSVHTSAFADFFVIPVNTAKKMANVIVVAKSGGDFTNVKSAVDSITDASASNNYLVYVGPGTYTVTEPIVLQQYVSLKGSGINVTSLYGNVSGSDSASSAIIQGASNSSISELTVVNLGGGSESVGIYHNGSVVSIISQVLIFVTGQAKNYGIYNRDADVDIANISINVAISGTHNHAICNISSSGSIVNTLLEVYEGTSENYGIKNTSSSPVISNTQITVAGTGSITAGIHNVTSSPKMNNIVIDTSYGDTNYGIYSDHSSLTISHAVITAKNGENVKAFWNKDPSSLVIDYVKATAIDGSENNYGLYINNISPTITHSNFTGATLDILLASSNAKCLYTIGNGVELNGKCE